MATCLKPYTNHRTIRGFLALLVFFLSFFSSYSQRFNNWCFSAYTGITFNTTPVTSIASSSAAGGRSSATISDFNGGLLFYCDGQAIYNRLNQIMPNGGGLNGGFLNQSGGTMIIPFGDTSNKYHVFNSQGLVLGMASELGYTYNIVDMNLNGGLGDVIMKNVRLGSHNSSEKMAAAAHSNGADIWLITRDRFNNYFSYKVKCDGIDTLPSITTIGYNLNNPGSTYGVMKASPDGKILAVAFTQSFELFRLNQTNGTLYDRIALNIRQPFGVEFSPDSRLLYTTSVRLQNVQFGEVLQFDLSVYDSTNIQNSQQTVSSIAGQNAFLITFN